MKMAVAAAAAWALLKKERKTGSLDGFQSMESPGLPPPDTTLRDAHKPFAGAANTRTSTAFAELFAFQIK